MSGERLSNPAPRRFEAPLAFFLVGASISGVAIAGRSAGRAAAHLSPAGLPGHAVEDGVAEAAATHSSPAKRSSSTPPRPEVNLPFDGGEGRGTFEAGPLAVGPNVMGEL